MAIFDDTRWSSSYILLSISRSQAFGKVEDCYLDDRVFPSFFGGIFGGSSLFVGENPGDELAKWV